MRTATLVDLDTPVSLQIRHALQPDDSRAMLRDFVEQIVKMILARQGSFGGAEYAASSVTVFATVRVEDAFHLGLPGSSIVCFLQEEGWSHDAELSLADRIASLYDLWRERRSTEPVAS